MPVLSPNPAPSDGTGACSPWADTLPCADTGEGGDDPEVIARALTIATWVVWALSGRQYGVSCPSTVRPCIGPCDHRPCPTRCHLRSGVLLDLGRGGVTVTEVTVDGTALPPDAWRVQDGRWLRRLDGQPWPTVQDFDLPAGEPGTWSYTYTVGAPPPEAGVLAVQDYGCHVLLALRPGTDGRCKLPKRVRTVARQGVAIEMNDPTRFLVDGSTGIDSVDVFAGLANPGRSPEPPRVWSPDYDSAGPVRSRA